MPNLLKKLGRSRASYRAAAFALAIALVACADAAIGVRAAQIFA